ncbi:MAG: contact-dependent growth inhibition system immunity protein [Acidobacteriota bacterium]
MNYQFDRSKSLQELEGKDWSEPTYSSYLVTTCHALRRKPLNQFSVEDLRILIGQSIGLGFLIPLALEILAENPMTGGDYYPGDLLKNVLRINSFFWQENPELHQKMRAIIFEVESLKKTIEDEILPAAEKFKNLDIFSQ